ncbi:class I adenylate-forming enzyme family protein [Halorubrum pallidum]
MRDWLSHRVVASPDATALVRAEDGEAWTYTDLDHLVSETAGRLVARGITEGDRLGVLTPPYVGTVGLVHAAMRIGATFVPLGPDLTEHELRERVERAGLSAVVCAESTEDAACSAVDDIESVPVYSVDEPTIDTVEAVHAVDPEPVEPVEWGFSDHLCLLFTSGTTGDPKGVPLTAGNVYSSAVASAFRLGVDPDDRWLVSLSLHHMGGLAPVYRSVLYGTTLVLREGFRPGETADDIDTYDVTGVSLVPTMLTQMLDRRGTLSDSLRAVLLGGAPAPDDLLERCRDYSIPVYPTYGMTESASQIATATSTETSDRLGTVGRPLFGTDVTVVDEAGTPVDPGERGEIVVDGPTVTPGYADPDAPRELDRSAFGEYGLHTGDVGRFDEDGYLYVLNRLDDRIISGGENVDPGEVLDALRSVPGIEDAAVVGLDDDLWGERVAALIVAERDVVGTADTADTESGESVDIDDGNGDIDDGESDEEDGDVDIDDGESDEEDGDIGDIDDGEGDEEAQTAATDETGPATVDDERLVSVLRTRLAGFKLPKTIAYVEELPRTVSGTVDRAAVREILRNRGYDPRNGPEAELETAGFEPADPADPSEADGEDGSPADPEAIESVSEGRDRVDEAESDGDTDSDSGDRHDGGAVDDDAGGDDDESADSGSVDGGDDEHGDDECRDDERGDDERGDDED